tara:strand:+ start:4094 stop:4324 length:231 start_codon:yes stop_codon:yes gene_type:complete
MSDNNFKKIYTGSSILVLAIKDALNKSNIVPIIKDRSESARLAGFGSFTPLTQDIIVHVDEIEKSNKILKQILENN